MRETRGHLVVRQQALLQGGDTIDCVEDVLHCAVVIIIMTSGDDVHVQVALVDVVVELETAGV